MERREFNKGVAATLAAAAMAPAALAVAATDEFETDFIMPDIRFPDASERTVNDNTITIHYRYMTRWRRRHGEGDIRVECAEVGSARYATWLAERTDGRPYPPHVQFGGAVVPGKGDPEFYPRWVAYASTLS